MTRTKQEKVEGLAYNRNSFLFTCRWAFTLHVDGGAYYRGEGAYNRNLTVFDQL